MILSRHKRMLAFSMALFLSSSIAVLAEEDEGTGVTLAKVAPIEVEYQFYEPGAKPTKVPIGMKALTEPSWKFVCRFNWVHFDHPPTYKFQIKSATCDIALPMIITLPKDAPNLLKEHEQGHRKINEYFYNRYSAGAIKKAAGLMIGKELEIKASSYDEAKKQIVQQAVQEVAQAYRKQTSTIAERANVYYDQLTDHGRKDDVDSVVASNEAIKRFDGQSEAQPLESNQSPPQEQTGQNPPSTPAAP